MYSLEVDRERKFILALRTALPVVALMLLLLTVTLQEQRSVIYNTAILLAGLFISVYFIFFMLFTSTKEKILDEITNTFNRHYFLSFLRKNLDPARSYLALISIDNIKDINERYGIDNGDKVLKRFATILHSYFSTFFQPLPIGRVKGGDFLLLLNGKEEQVKEAIEQFLQTYDNYFIDNIEIKLLATYEFIDHTDVKKLLDHLYEELYFCKGKCQSAQDTTYHKKRQDRSAFEKLIQTIIAQKRLSLLYQPTYNMHTKSFDYIELIVKLVDEEGNFIHPSQYIPLVNRLGLENSFDFAVLEKMLEEIEEFALPCLYYSLNISPFSIRNKRFNQKFWSIIKSFSLPPEYIVIELFESGVYKDLKYYREIVQNYYRKRGLKIAFDNFGACNASLEYIKFMDVDFVHFDKFFTKKIDNLRYKILLEHWIEVLHKLQIQNIIKFLDQPALVERFASLGADYLQGFAIAKPMEAKELKTFLGEKNALR